MKLKEYIKKHKLTQRTMADKLGITVPYLCRLIHYGASPSRKLAVLIEEATNGEVNKEEAIFNEGKQNNG